MPDRFTILPCDEEGFKTMYKDISFCWTFLLQFWKAYWMSWMSENWAIASEYYFDAYTAYWVNGFNYWYSLYWLMKFATIDWLHCELS